MIAYENALAIGMRFVGPAIYGWRYSNTPSPKLMLTSTHQMLM